MSSVLEKAIVVSGGNVVLLNLEAVEIEITELRKTQGHRKTQCDLVRI